MRLLKKILVNLLPPIVTRVLKAMFSFLKKVWRLVCLRFGSGKAKSPQSLAEHLKDLSVGASAIKDLELSFKGSLKRLRKAVKDIFTSYRQETELLKRKARTRIIVKELVLQKEKILLEIGSGGQNGWTTLDHFMMGSDLEWDLNDGIPFSDSSVHKIYSSHVLEHFSYHEVQRLLKDCYRSLARGGGDSLFVCRIQSFILTFIARAVWIIRLSNNTVSMPQLSIRLQKLIC